MVGGYSTCLLGGAGRTGLVQAGEEAFLPLQVVFQEDGARVFIVVHGGRMRSRLSWFNPS